ncbi:hypothetical protein [Kandleria vitulina]|uniref:hypothetical protein n=1 Tax=Kandleria vitulina TaxID=1630 RepID=UPI0033333AAC
MIDILKKRFTENKERHLVISFEEVEKKLTPKILHSLTMMEEAEKMGVRLMNKEEYRYLQTLHLAGL